MRAAPRASVSLVLPGGTRLPFLRDTGYRPASPGAGAVMSPMGSGKDAGTQLPRGFGAGGARGAAGGDSRLYVARGLDHYEVLARPSPGLILALRAFAHDIRTAAASRLN